MNQESRRVLRLLLVEDMPADARLVLWALRRMPMSIEHRCVADAEAMRAALEEFSPDVILSDFEMPGFGGNEALSIAQALAPAIPFIFVSGAIGEQVAIDALQRGAVDFVLKDNLRHLPSAIERALRVARDRHEHERMQRALADSEARFRAIVETSKDWIWECDREARITYTNPAIQDFIGHAPSELLGVSALPWLDDASRHEVEEVLPRHVDEGTGWRDWRLVWKHRDGSHRIQESIGMPLLDQYGKLLGFRGINRDITERLRHEAKITALARIHAVLADMANAVLNATDRGQLLADACRVAVETGGFRVAGIGELRDGALHVVAVHGDPVAIAAVAPDEPMHLDDDSDYYHHPGIRAMREGVRVAVADFGDENVPAPLRHQMAACGVKSEVALPIGTPPWGVLALYSGSEVAHDEQEIALLERLAGEIDHGLDFLARSEREQFLAYRNPATGLPNSAAFHTRVAPMLRRRPLAVVAVEATRLGHVAATRGRRFLNRLLQALGARLQEDHRFVAHAEGARFLMAYPASGSDEVEALDATLREIEQTPITIDDEMLRVSLRAGVVVAMPQDLDSEALEAHALTALERAAEHDVHVAGYNDDMRRQAQREVQLERDLQQALERGEFELAYQPKFEARTKRLTGAEALLRWRHPVEGHIPPAEFIPMLEQTGLIVPVGVWIAREALSTALSWREAHDPSFRIAINVSARELRHRAFLQERQALLAAHAANQALDFEITESLLMDDLDHSVAVLEGLRALGCRLAIDDFGTGYSSLNYLARLPVDAIKIDQSFVAQLDHNPQTLALTTHTISLAHSLGLSTVAEGVETAEQAKLLHLLRCDVLQGFWLGRPLCAADFREQVLERSKS